MNKLAALAQFLYALDLVASEQIDAWAEDMSLVPRYQSRGDGGVILFERWYTAWFVFERWPHQNIDVDILLSHIMVWLLANDPERDRDRGETDPEIDVDILDNNLADLTVTIRFREEVGIVPDAAGAIEYQGQRWRVETPAVWPAEAGEIA
ncbi:P2 phage tail completion protein R (GpR) [Methylomagnum ishizawai]|uniref:P2 phage tail completion protein R (GpR) n=1 Tax=Methylomagnum ishizawai TaxID=1760988 RepID=A0A1Y6D0Q4_9GAMM|nr:phage tail protein [Methylomagnum ishizawai]SMF94423.1 P2 phage tail completion protein R (GpR) [Methylomagnum ishizawai]